MLGKSACYLNLIDDVNKEYIGYLLKNRHFQKYIDSNATGTTIKNVSLQTIRSYEFELPSKKNQQDVSNFLSSFDRKIELNQKLNETLEEIAKTLFKSWFIDFDPVRAKAEGRPTGLSKEISDLFPDSFEDSELGKIPKSWHFLTFGDFVTPIRGKVITKKTTNPGDIPVVAGGLEPAYFHSIANVQGPVVTISASGANAGYTKNTYRLSQVCYWYCSYIVVSTDTLSLEHIGTLSVAVLCTT